MRQHHSKTLEPLPELFPLDIAVVVTVAKLYDERH
jgi:hypothetical protein